MQIHYQPCRRLVAARCLPDRAGQPAQDSTRPHGDRQYGPYGDGPGDDCDASIAPVVTGHVDHELLDRLAAILLRQPPASTSPANHDDAARPGGACARDLILRHAVALLSGPAGLAARLRTSRHDCPDHTRTLHSNSPPATAA
jgi:hypothetical protein